MGDESNIANFVESGDRIQDLPRGQLIEIAASSTLWERLPDNPPQRFTYATTIAGALHEQYTDTGEYEFNQRALEYLQQVLKLSGEAPRAAQAKYAETCAKCFLAQGIEFSSEEDLDEATDCAESAVLLTDEAESQDAIALSLERRSTWSSCYLAKWFNGEEKSVDWVREASKIAVEGMQIAQKMDVALDGQIPVLHNYAMAQTIMFDETGEWCHLAAALEISEKNVTTLGSIASENRHEWEANLAFRLLRAYKYVLDTGVESDEKFLCKGRTLREKAVKAITKALNTETNRPLSKLENSLAFVLYIEKLPVEEQNETLAACAGFLKEAVNTLADVALLATRVNRRKLLTTFYGISRYAAAACCAASTNAAEALDVLERGRGIASSLQATSGSIEPSSAAGGSVDAELEQQLVQARKKLDDAVATGQPHYVRASLFEEFAALRAEGIGKGLLNSDAGITNEKAIELGSEGDIIVVNVTNIRSDAIIITKAGLRTLPLPLANEDSLSEKSWIIQQALAHDVDDPVEFQKLWAALTEMLAQLWKQIARPVLSELGYTKCPQDHDVWPRVWWVPTGVLCMYPIHAAGLGLHTNKNVIHRVISSYTSTLTALARLRSRAGYTGLGSTLTKVDNVKAAVVAMHSTPSYPPFQFVKEEIEIIRSCFRNVKILEQPKCEEVLEVLESALTRFFHYSCHGDVEFEDPSQSRLLLQDWEEHPLTIELLRERMLPTDRTAFLSACYTAHAGVENEQDECNNIVNALQAAGFCGVIGSLWFVREQSTLELTRGFYHYFKSHPHGFGTRLNKEALHLATLALAKASCNAGNEGRGNPLLWAPFVYFGI